MRITIPTRSLQYPSGLLLELAGLLLLGSFASLGIGGLSAEEQNVRGVTQATLVTSAPKLDGTLSDPAWKKAPLLVLGEVTGPGPAPVATTARLLLDDKFLYAAFDCSETDTQNLKKDVTARDGHVWEDDCVELFISADPDLGYKHIAINPAGAILDQACDANGGQNPGWNGEVQAKVAVEEGKRWSVTLSVPLTDLDAYVAENVSWRINLTRTRPSRNGGAEQECSWAVLPTDKFHQLAAFGQFNGITIPERADGVTRKRDKPVSFTSLHKVDTGTQAGDVVVYYKLDFEKDTGGFQPLDQTGLDTVDESLSGKALRLRRVAPAGGFGASLGLNLPSPKDLKVAFHAKASGVPQAGLIATDSVSKLDTTTSSVPWLSKDAWSPCIYYLDRFKYLASGPPYSKWAIRAETIYSNILLHGEEEGGKDTCMLVDNFVIFRGQDHTPPGPVNGLRAEPKADGVHLSWEPATDNVAVMLYSVSRSAGSNGPFTKISESFGTSFVDSSAAPGEYRYRVLACDFEENSGPWSAPISVKNQSSGKPAETTLEAQEAQGYRENVQAIASRGANKVDRGSVVCYGDTLTGIKGYPVDVQGVLGSKRVAAHGHFGLSVNRGGDGGKGVAAQGGALGMDSFEEDNPYIILLLYGSGNSKDEEGIRECMEDLTAFSKTATDAGIIPIIGTLPPRGLSEEELKRGAAYNAAVIETCKKLKLPCGHLFEAYQNHPQRETLLKKDGVGQTEESIKAYAQAWGRAVRQVQFVLRDKP